MQLRTRTFQTRRVVFTPNQSILVSSDHLPVLLWIIQIRAGQLQATRVHVPACFPDIRNPTHCWSPESGVSRQLGHGSLENQQGCSPQCPSLIQMVSGELSILLDVLEQTGRPLELCRIWILVTMKLKLRLFVTMVMFVTMVIFVTEVPAVFKWLTSFPVSF